MEIFYRSKGIENYIDVRLEYISEADAGNNGFRLSMLRENDITGIIRPIILQGDDVMGLRFKTGSLYILDRVFQVQKPDGELLKSIMNQLVGSIRRIEEYLISADDLVLEPEFMTYDGQSRELRLICVPGYNVEIKAQLKSFLEYVMKMFDYRDNEGIGYLYSLYELATDFDSGVEKLLSYVEGYDKGSALISVEESVYTGDNMDSRTYDICAISDADEAAKMAEAMQVTDTTRHKKIKTENKAPVIIWELILLAGGMAFSLYLYLYRGRSERSIFVFISLCVIAVAVVVTNIFFGEDSDTSLQKDEGDDELFGGNMKGDGKSFADEIERADSEPDNKNYLEKQAVGSVTGLIPMVSGNVEKLDLKPTSAISYPISIGRLSGEADYALGKNQISRHHASIYHSDEGVYYLEDNNSTNGTYINSERMNANQLYVIKKGDIISFANEEFYVK